MTDPASRASRFAFFLLSLLFLFWAAWGHSIPAPAVRWTLAVGGLALGLLGGTHRTPLEAFGRWTALAMAGQACALQLLDVGKDNRLQLFHEWERLLTTYRLVFFLFVLVQAAIVVWGAARFWKPLSSGVRALVSPWEVLAILALWAFAATAVAPITVQAIFKGNLPYRLAAQGAKVALGLLVTGAATINLVLAVAAMPRDSWERITDRFRRMDRRRVLWTCVAWTVAVSSLLSWFVMDRLPHIPDDVAYLFHAKYFAAGKLYLPQPPEPQAFACSLALFDGNRWFSAQLPGWPAVLAIGAGAGVPWLISPLLGGLAVLLTYIFVKELYDEQIALSAAALLSFSPWLLYMSATYMGHPVSLVFTLVSLMAVQRARKTGSLLASAVAGLATGALAVTRPVEALVLAIPMGLWWLSIGWRRLRMAALATTVACGLAVISLMLAYNQALTGDPRTLPFEKVTDLSLYTGANRLGFGKDVGNFGWEHLDPLPGHGPIDVAVNTNHNLYMVHFELFGWASGSLLFVFFLLASRRQRGDLLMWSMAFAIWAGMSCYWFSGGADFGARYWYQMILPLTVLTARGIQEIINQWDAFGAEGKGLFSRSVWAFVALAFTLGFLNFVPWRAIDKYKNYRGVRDDVRRLAAKYEFGRSIVFIRGGAFVAPWASSSYASAFSLNPPTVGRDAPGPIYARDLGPASRDRLRQYYADRPAWILAAPELTGDGFVVLEGPLSPSNSPSSPR